MNNTYTHPAWGNPFTSFSLAEQRVDALARQVELEVSLHEARWLLAGGQYEAHVGLGAGRHYRKPRRDGCYHLRVNGQRAFLHWDEWDPRRHPIEHFFETPALWGSALVLAVGALFIATQDDG
ncbi:hypothetical protein [Melittangium boletus]|uniref:Uncharacterized protein n=1 Tax=Melittangium boletus DSM 14713 TaxID=1294270 RepID=A0A250IPP5_9BACT|nr:hypothetical protein [Melittangium boletus]ATB33223.1 hypothetical protein MEBOL_006712 [Melittangium boletus DSM 14713]